MRLMVVSHAKDITQGILQDKAIPRFNAQQCTLCVDRVAIYDFRRGTRLEYNINLHESSSLL